jgi:putative flippase GtrA
MKAVSHVPRLANHADLRQIAAFGCVGCLALAVHYTVVTLLVPIGLGPLVANVAGFLCALGISFAGHERWSFRANGPRRRRMHRFTVVAVGGFLASESLYWSMLRFTDLSYRASLPIVLGTVAVLTFVSSKYWAFSNGTS